MREGAPALGQIDPSTALDALAGSESPLLLGVRHHSPACAAAIPKILDGFRPDRVLIELPEDLGKWLNWLGNDGLVAPVALAAVRTDMSSLFFYPFAEFSPELAAIRWAVQHQVPVEAIDLPYCVSTEEEADGPNLQQIEQSSEPPKSLVRSVIDQTSAGDSEDLWDQLVEARAPGQDADAVRRAALLFGWMMRHDAVRAGGVSKEDLRRESFMRSCLARHGLVGFCQKPSENPPRVVAVIGSFHASALLGTPLLVDIPEYLAPKKMAPADKVVSSLIAYSFELLDSRSGYPAGIRDPAWQQKAYLALRDGSSMGDLASETVVAIAREMRGMGHVAGVPDAQEASRMAQDLSRLRSLPAPSRRELLESIQSCFAQGELLGRGRILARALDRVLVGRNRGKLPPGAPRSGLGPHVETLLAALKLPGPSSTSKEATQFDLDPLRSKLDRRRNVALERLHACGVSYGDKVARASANDAELLSVRWSLQWTPKTEAFLELAGLRGVSLAQAASGTLIFDQKTLEREDKLGPAARLQALRCSAECGLAELTTRWLLELQTVFLAEAGLKDLIDALALVERIEKGHVPGLPSDPADADEEFSVFAFPREFRKSELIAAAVQAVDGLAGSDQLDDAYALLELVNLYERQGQAFDALGDGRLGFAVQALARSGSPLMQGAGGASCVLLGREDPTSFAVTVASWIDCGSPADQNNLLSGRLRGAIALAGPLFEAHPLFMDEMIGRIDALEDKAFLERLPALREGFDVLSASSRARLLEALSERWNLDSSASTFTLEESPEALALYAAADAAGAKALMVHPVLVVGELEPGSSTVGRAQSVSDSKSLSLTDRFRLILGKEREKLKPSAMRYAQALDELYGAGHGEGSRGNLGGGAGQEKSFPTVREWSAELEELFGASVKEEVLGRAVEHGQTAAIFGMDPDSVVPSVELLEQVLSLKGGLAERDLERLRKMVQRVVDALVKELAQRVRPALTGLATPRPTRRAAGPLDLRRTIGANLHTARPKENGQLELVPDRLIFKTRSKRSMDWRVVLVVDVSGSMEASVIYSAMMAAILSGLPAVDVRFVAFNTEVLDLSEKVDDPLGLLLEVRVGGGTSIGKALRYTRGLMKVPARTIVLVISDFEEGESVPVLLSEVRAIVESGAKILGLAALDDRGAARYHKAIAQSLVNAGMPVAALTPLELAQWVGEKIR